MNGSLRWNQCRARLAQEAAMLIRVVDTQGSVPREVGAWMLVFASDSVNTIGGGHLEFQAMQIARSRLALAEANHEERFALGPALGQCCGGVVVLRFEKVTSDNADALMSGLLPRLHPLALFGAGHVGHALVRLLVDLPFELTWIDSRDEIFPAELSANVHCEHSDPVASAVATLPAGSRVLIMSFSHAEDLDIVEACLARQRSRGDLPYIGLIGSKSKWARFGHRLQERGYSAIELSHVTCPIGVAGIAGKEPAVIAVAVAAQLLKLRGTDQELHAVNFALSSTD